MKKRHKKLNLAEREQLAILKARGKSFREIGKILGRSHTSLSREWKRNQVLPSIPSSYTPIFAEFQAQDRARDSRRIRRLKNKQIRDYVTQKLEREWSPEQISGRIQIDHPGLQISHEAIYQFVYQEARHLANCLPRHHPYRRLRYYTLMRKKKLLFPSRTFIDQRPNVINQRLQFGHWESDSIVSRASRAALHLLHERKSRFVKINKLNRNNSAEVKDAIIAKLKHLAPEARLSITYDNGSENVSHLDVNRQLQTASYFCHPYHSWEKGAVENSAGLIRRFLPKKTDFQYLSNRTISTIERKLNNRPRKCLNYKTPKEVFDSLYGAITH